MPTRVLARVPASVPVSRDAVPARRDAMIACTNDRSCPQLADGTAYEIGEECQSGDCEQFRCTAAAPSIGCPVALPAW